MQQVDAEGVHSGGVKHVLRSLQRWTAEGHHLRRYQAEIGGGHHVVDVCVLGRRQRDAVVQILRTRGGHFINYRAPGTHAPGSGLGLSIVQRIVDLHRGTMRPEPPLTGIGLEVSIALPRVQGERV